MKNKKLAKIVNDVITREHDIMAKVLNDFRDAVKGQISRGLDYESRFRAAQDELNKKTIEVYKLQSDLSKRQHEPSPGAVVLHIANLIAGGGGDLDIPSVDGQSRCVFNPLQRKALAAFIRSEAERHEAQKI